MTLTKTAIGTMTLPELKGFKMLHRVKNVTTSILRGLCGVLLLSVVMAGAAKAQPTLSKVFTPSTIGPSSVSMITFTITNGSGTPVTDLAFTDALPAAITIAAPPAASTTCANATLTTPAGGGVITFSDGSVGASSSCTVMVQVTASTLGAHTNPAVTLSSSAGSSMSLAVDLTVVATLPGFSKSFAPSSVSLGSRSTLTFTMDNTANAGRVGNLDFTDNLLAGMVVADPSNAATDCISANVPNTTITATPGSSLVVLDANGSNLFAGFEVLPAGAVCTVTVDVIGQGVGVHNNVTGDLLADFVISGKASASLAVTAETLTLRKLFTDDPVPPGGTAALEFTIDNFDRFDPATAVAFTDDLGAALTGLTFDSLLSNDCGGSVTGVGTTMIALTGGTLSAESSCTIRVSLSVPAGAAPGAYPNTTTTITGTIGGSPVVGNMASETLFVEPVPLLTKEFTDDPVTPGAPVTLRFSITNTSTTSGATDIAFRDELTTFLPFPLSVALPPTPDPPCGAGSTLAVVFVDTERQALSLTGGNLAAAPGPGAACTFDVVVNIPSDFPAGNHLNTIGEITATVDGATRTGQAASDTLQVIAAPDLSKAFTDDPAVPGGAVTLEFTLEHSPNSPTDATDFAFTDDLNATLTGLTLSSVLSNTCGGAVTGIGMTNFDFSGGGPLAPGASCLISVSLTVPAGAAGGTYANSTSALMATVGGATRVSPPANADLTISAVLFTKEFIDDPVIPGGTVTLRFTIENMDASDATIGSFSDSLTTALSGLAATGGPTTNTCGGVLSGTTSLTYAGGTVTSGATCTIEVPLLVPAGAPDGTFLNTTNNLTTNLGSHPPATDVLTVNSNLIFLTKSFTDDPVLPGNTATLEFTLINSDPAQAASGIAFDDDLGAALTGLIASAALGNDCGGGMVAGIGTDMISFSGGSLGAGASCTIALELTVPGAAASGSYGNTTSAVTATIGGLAVTGDPASDDLDVGVLVLTKSFGSMPEPGQTVVLTFTIENVSMSDVQADIGFTDDLSAVVSGLAATGLPMSNVCGAGSTASGSSLLAVTGANLLPGGSCSIPVTLQVPAGASLGSFLNTTSDLMQTGLSVAPSATDSLVVTAIITNSATATAAGATPAMGQTIDTVQP